MYCACTISILLENGIVQITLCVHQVLFQNRQLLQKSMYVKAFLGTEKNEHSIFDRFYNFKSGSFCLQFTVTSCSPALLSSVGTIIFQSSVHTF